MQHHWIGDAEYLFCDDPRARWLIGEDTNGEWWIRERPDDMWRTFNRWNPLHWLRYWTSRRRGQVAFLNDD